MLNFPNEKPRLSSEELQLRISKFNIDRMIYPVVVIGIRGYYKNTMGAPEVNDRGIYDDAIFINTPQVTAAFNGNTDPSAYRKGVGFAEHTKGMASLNPGAWLVYKFGMHRGKYLALCQLGGSVTVTRDGSPNYADTGNFGINIHKGSYDSTSSAGCQTIHPDQWRSFISLVKDQAVRYFGDKFDSKIIPYVLLEEE